MRSQPKELRVNVPHRLRCRFAPEIPQLRQRLGHALVQLRFVKVLGYGQDQAARGGMTAEGDVRFRQAELGQPRILGSAVRQEGAAGLAEEGDCGFVLAAC